MNINVELIDSDRSLNVRFSLNQTYFQLQHKMISNICSIVLISHNFSKVMAPPFKSYIFKIHHSGLFIVDLENYPLKIRQVSTRDR